MNAKLKNIKAKTHPPHYMIHKYWGRKPHNIIKEYILNFTQENESVLDPFMGSGVVIIESLKSKRKAIGVDLNPIASFIVKNTINQWNPYEFEKEFKEIYSKNYKKFSKLYHTICPKCLNVSYLENSIWNNDDLLRIRGYCGGCGKFVKDADEFDREKVEESKKLFKKLNNENELSYPKDKILKYVQRSNRTHLNELFTERALIILGTLIKDINRIRSDETKNLVLMCFTSMLPNVSIMIPGDISSANGKSGWVISKLWVPGIHTEKNIFKSFLERYKKVRKGKIELYKKVNPEMAKILNTNAEDLSQLKSKSIDYILTDPPYGESIAYFGLSMFWNAWLDYKVDYDNEIIYDPYRNKRYEDYAERMKNVFRELYRVLKDGKFLSFTFHNRNLNIWKAVMDAVKSAGFHLRDIVYQDQAVSSGTQGINRKNTLRGDFVYNFYKNTNMSSNYGTKQNCSEKTLVELIDKWMRTNGKFITSDQLYERLIPIIVENNWYVNDKGIDIDVERLLKKNFNYALIENNGKAFYAWQKE